MTLNFKCFRITTGYGLNNKNNMYLTKISKRLSFLLRHCRSPQYIDLNGGWAEVEDVISQLHINRKTLEQIVVNDEKQRFSFDDTKTKIRANNGHSISGVTIETLKKEPPEILYHGTATRFLESILTDGLKPMNRIYVQLSGDYETSYKVGSRHGDSVVVEIRALDFVKDGGNILLSPNGVWQADYIPKEYICHL